MASNTGRACSKTVGTLQKQKMPTQKLSIYSHSCTIHNAEMKIEIHSTAIVQQNMHTQSEANGSICPIKKCAYLMKHSHITQMDTQTQTSQYKHAGMQTASTLAALV